MDSENSFNGATITRLMPINNQGRFHSNQRQISKFNTIEEESEGIEMGTELDKEIEEAANIEGNVGDEFSVLPVRLHRYPDVHRVCNPTCPCHLFLPPFSSERITEIRRLLGQRPKQRKEQWLSVSKSKKQGTTV